MVNTGFLLSTALLLASTETALTGGEQDLARYAMTQGGLAVVLLIVLWVVRKDHLAKVAEKNEQLATKDAHLKILTDLAVTAATAQTKTADALDRMARAVEWLNDRRSGPTDRRGEAA